MSGEGISITGTAGDCSDGYSCLDGDYAQTVTIGSNGYILDFCYDFMQILYFVDDRMVLRFIF